MHTRISWIVLAVWVILIVHPDSGFAQNEPTYRYLNQSAVLWDAANDQAHKVGKLLVAAPVQVISTQDQWTEVLIQGWTQAGAERVLYAAPGMRIMRAALSKSAVQLLGFAQTIEDQDTGLTWTRTQFQAWLRNPKLEPGLQGIWDRAEPLFAERCTACHQRRIPHHYTANQWNSFLKIMGPRTGLPKEQQMLIRAYLQHHAKDKDRLSDD